MVATAETRAEHEQDHPIDRLRNLLKGTDHKEFQTPSLKIFVCTWAYENPKPESIHPENEDSWEKIAKKHDGEVLIYVGNIDSNIDPLSKSTSAEFTEWFEVNQDEIRFGTDDEVLISARSRLNFNVISYLSEEQTIYSEESWSGKEYGQIINKILEALSQAQEVPSSK